MSEFIRIRTGVGYTPGFEETIEGPSRSEWEDMTSYQRYRYLGSVTADTLTNVDAWAYVVEDES